MKAFVDNQGKLKQQEELIAKMKTEIVKINEVKADLEANYKQITEYINGLNAKIQSILIVTASEFDGIIADINANILDIDNDTDDAGNGTISAARTQRSQLLLPGAAQVNPSAGRLSGLINKSQVVPIPKNSSRGFFKSLTPSFTGKNGGNKTKKGGWKYNKASSSYRRSSSRRIYASKKKSGKSSRGTTHRSK